MVRRRSLAGVAPDDAFTRLVRSGLGVECVREYRFHETRKWRFDYAIPSKKVALEVEGGVFVRGRHVSPVGFLRDMEKYNAAAALGWTVLRCTPKTLFSQSTLELIIDAVNRECVQ